MAPNSPTLNAGRVKRRGSSNAARPRQTGDRYPSGKLRAQRFALECREDSGEVAARGQRGVCVYVIGPPYGPYKIGFTNSVQGRLKTLSTGSPTKLEVHFALEVGPVARDIESLVHMRLAQHRLHGEWFSVAVRDAVTAIRDAMSHVEAGLFPRSA